MAAYDSLTYSPVVSTALERVHYFPRQLITADDMLAEQGYLREKLRRHNRYLHGWGVVCGCEVVPAQNGRPWEVQVCPGYAITPQGDEILIREAIKFDLAGDWRQPYDPCARPMPCGSTGVAGAEANPQKVFLAVCYAECNSRPVRVQLAGCACDEAACEYSRIRESFELVRLEALPKSHTQAFEADTNWHNAIITWKNTGNDTPPPLPSCPNICDDNCVVLASITQLKDRQTQIVPGQLTYVGRRVLYSVTAWYGMM